ncbi:hypothetical protein SHIRM173S_09076 [Streptomyces hirsutus]
MPSKRVLSERWLIRDTCFFADTGSTAQIVKS